MYVCYWNYCYDKCGINFTYVLSLCLIVSSKKEIPSPVTTVLKQEMDKIYGTKSAHELNEDFLVKFSNSLPHLLQGKIPFLSFAQKLCF